jgi:thioredoxin-related protein
VFPIRAVAHKIRVALFLPGLLVLAVQPLLFAAEKGIPVAEDLAKSARISQQQGIPVVVFVSRDACPYCRTLRNSILEPMLAADKFEQRAMLLEVNLDRVDPLTGFDGQPTTARSFGEFYEAGITPTLLFLDADGLEIAKRRIGISNLDLYGFYMQESIDDALASIRSRDH